MQVRVLGGMEVVVDGVAVDLGGPKQRNLLAILVAADGHSVGAERLVDLLWGDEPPEKAMVSLHAYVARLRRLLEPVRERRAPARVLVSRPPGYALVLDGIDVDAHRFTALLAEASPLTGTDPGRAEELLRTALDLWRGEAFGGAAGPVRAEATRLEELRLTAVEDLWATRIQLGRHGPAAAELELLVEAHPLRERLWALLALALYRSARQADALDALRRARRRLGDEAGLDPGLELRRLEQAVLRQAPELTAPVVALPAGREDALAEVCRALAGAATGPGHIVLVSGEPGIGKTYLADAVVEHATAAGYRCGWGGWESDASAPLWGWQQAVRQLLGDTGLLQQTGSEPVDAASSTFRFAGALVAALRAGPPSLLVLEDVHWADADSLRLLRRFASTLADVPVVLLVTCRDAEADITPLFGEALAALARLDPVRVRLEGLDETAVGALVRRRSGIEVGPEVAAAVRDRTDGNPFYINEFVRLLTAAGDLADPAAPSWREVPGGVRDVVRQRLAQLPEQVGEVMAAAAVLGRSFDLDVVEEAVAAAPGVVDEAVGTALRSGLVEEEAPGRLRYTHALVRDAIYHALPAPARARAHARAAQALERRRIGRLEPHTAQLAEHYRLAGAVHARSAWTFASRAGRRAAANSAHDEALRLFRLAAESQQHDPLVTEVEREAVLTGLGRAQYWMSSPAEAWISLAEVAASALDRGDAVTAARALLVISERAIWTWRDYGESVPAAVELWQRVLARIPDSEPVLRALVQSALAIELLYHPDTADRATRLVDEAVRVARASDSPSDLSQMLQLAHLAMQRPDLLDRRVAIADELVILTGRLDDAAGLAGALCKRAVDRAESGSWQPAIADVRRAHRLAEQHQLVPVLIIAGAALALARQAAGDFAGAEAEVERLETLQSTVSMAPFGLGLAQLATMRLVQGRLAELEPALRQAAGQQPVFRDLHGLALIACSRADEARMMLGDWAEQRPLLWDYTWPGLTAIRARLWLELGDQRAIAELRQQLTPYAGRLAVGGMGAFFLGSISHTVGQLALAAGDRTDAAQHLRHALDTHRRLGFEPLAAATEALLDQL